ncbi:multisubunit potassium/proton antiporter, PhaA subunit /multisubunit potassium/proton antiporter, PhaB subunit [Sphingomonas laterariae]|uniref:Multisubunit potassium/proton antiporter, PhaA subunit /multisubunit potassium/proton antiporter, PhaB subunit n=1 Tax=Edaphosphingomonas laterariae TaxID=861865 RepID=A0A239K2K5_9SPHN|nr:monovalent cation/H+ antiporter subunit A [Sphingomonas laterariae]SNT12220.1 multisubunit potassium/proton antiporter, PhaA subunit /multisubunit potassium/proton antiporter, PhaB subunit [Sphingomonas laterariae]
MTDAGSLFFILALPYLGAIIAAFLPARGRNWASSFTGLTTLLALGLLVRLYPAVSQEVPLRETVPWLPSLGLDLTMRLDGFSWLFAVLILGIGALVILYARYYMSPDDPVPRFFSFLQAFMGSMLGLVLSGNLVQIVFFWEMTSLFSFLLIGYWHHNQAARDGARMALIMTATGGVCLLVGLLLLGQIAGSYDIDVVLAKGALIRSHDLYLPTLILILIGAFTKSAQFPFHFWLPHAMAAPTPVSAYLHSATMVKAGIYLLILLWPVLSGTEAWYLIVATTGLATLLVGAWSAIFQHDLKGLLAYSTISHLGLITLLLGLGSPLAAVAAIFHTVNHATFKASLFMAAGIIDHETGTRDLRKLSGLIRFMPITATLAMVAAAAMAGVPLLNGFLSKEMFLAEALEAHSGTVLDRVLPVLATLASMFSVLYSVRFIHQTFFGPAPTGLPRTPHEAPHWMRLPIEILVLLCLIVGIIPALTIAPFLHSAVLSVLGERTPIYSLAIWHGFNMPLLMSVIALFGGALLYRLFRRRLNETAQSPIIGRLKGRRSFEAVLAALINGARVAYRLLGTRRQQVMLRLIIVTALVAGALPFVRLGYSAGTRPQILIDPVFALLWLLGGVAAVSAAMLAKFHRLAALTLVGVAGLSTCISFVWLSAPDLGLTQLLVEIITLVLLLLGLRWLPLRLPDFWSGERTPFAVRFRRGGDLLLASLGGIGAAALAYSVMTRPAPDGISPYFMEQAYPGGGGTNVVNVILVDFRGFDTLGEITVLSIVALTVFTLLRRFRPAAESVALPDQQQAQNASDDARDGAERGDTALHYLLVPRIIMEWLFPVILTCALYLLTRGHDLPGGGFAGGVTASIAILLLYMASGTRSVEARLNIQPVRWISAGLLLTCLTGAAATLFGFPFLSTHFRYLDLPVIGPVPVASALLFDIGVFAVVVGTTVLILIALAHQSIRTPRVPRAADETGNAEQPGEAR